MSRRAEFIMNAERCEALARDVGGSAALDQAASSWRRLAADEARHAVLHYPRGSETIAVRSSRP